MTHKELVQKMAEFLATKSRIKDEWYNEEHYLYAGPLREFLEFMGVKLAIPNYTPEKTLTQQEKDAMRVQVMRDLLPHIEDMFNLRYKELERKTQE